jgi:PAS domain S-box-containing protein
LRNLRWILPPFAVGTGVTVCSLIIAAIYQSLSEGHTVAPVRPGFLSNQLQVSEPLIFWYVVAPLVASFASIAVVVYLFRKREQVVQDEIEDLQAAERRHLQALVDTQRFAGVGTWRWMAEDECFEGSDGFQRILGLPEDSERFAVDLLSRLIHEEDQTRFWYSLSRAAESDQPLEFEFRVVRADGEIRHISMEGRPLQAERGEPRCLFGVCRDITQERRAETAFRESEDRYQSLYNETPAMLYSIDREGRMIGASNYWLRVLGYDRSDVIGRPVTDFFTEESRHYAAEKVRPAFLRMGFTRNVPFEFVKKNGEIMHVLLSEIGQWGGDGQLASSLAVLVDITDRRKAEEALHNSEATLRAVLEGISDAVFVKDRKGKYTMVNSAALAMFGKPVEAIVGMTDSDIFPPDIADDLSEADRIVLDSQCTKTLEREIEIDGEFRTLVATRSVYRDGSGRIRGIVGVFRDITERKRFAEQLTHAQKMEAVGQLTGGVAHDFNNILAVVLGDLELLNERLEREPRLHKLVQAAMRAAWRGADLTKRLLAFSRKQPLQPEVMDFNRLVSDMTDMLGRALGETIHIHTTLAADLWPAKIDPNQTESAILNLAVNARDAMLDGGQLTIETSNVEIGEDIASAEDNWKAGSYVCLTIKDTGLGMPPEVIDRGYEPFFTTKEMGRGSGLGLSIVYGFVKQSGGHIEIDSKVGQGTTVSLYFPKANETPAQEERSRPSAAERRGKGEIVLIVEDDPEMRNLACNLLSNLGYAVLEAKDGPEACAILERGEKIDLLFTDVVLPKGMSGADLAKEAQRLYPDLKVLYTSGYTANVLPLDGTDEGIHLISKPYRKSQLAEKLREVMEASASLAPARAQKSALPTEQSA